MGNLKIKMKFAIVAAMIAAVAAKCEPAKIHSIIFKDDKCNEVDKAATQKYGEVPKDKYELYDAGCHDMTKEHGISYTLECDKVGIHQGIFSDAKCMKETKYSTTYKWGVCEKATGGDVYFIIKHD